MAFVILVVAIGMIQPARAFAQQPAGLPTVDFTVEVLGSTLADFVTKMDAYAQLRRTLEQGLPPLTVTDDAGEIQRAERLLAARIRQARAGAGRGDIFTDAIRHGFRQLLRPVTNAATCALIKDDNPGEFQYPINSEYPKDKPLSTAAGRHAGRAAAPAGRRVLPVPGQRSDPSRHAGQYHPRPHRQRGALPLVGPIGRRFHTGHVARLLPPALMMGAMGLTAFRVWLLAGTAIAAMPLVASTRQPGPARQLLIVVDGLRPDYVTREAMPNLFALGRRGVVFARHHSVYPTVTRVNASSISTGAYPERHGLLGNSVFFPKVDAARFLDTADSRCADQDRGRRGAAADRADPCRAAPGSRSKDAGRQLGFGRFGPPQ